MRLVKLIVLSAVCCAGMMLLSLFQPYYLIGSGVFLLLIAYLGLIAVRTGRRDALTGLRNRRVLQEVGVRTGRWTAVYFDMDGLKQVNDRRGHENGDALLRDMADCLVVAAGRGEAYRVGGDEFLILSAESEDWIINRWNRACREHQMETTASWGAASGSGDDIPALIHRAEEEMYRHRGL